MMKKNDVREPKQKRSIDKKKRIIEAGFKLFSENGYHKTNTAEIAKEAGVSTGIVYNYFIDKRAILLETISLFRERHIEPLYKFMIATEPPMDLKALVEALLEAIVAGHNMVINAHEEMMAMSHSDADVAKLLRDYEMQTANKVASIMIGLGYDAPHIFENVRVAICLMEHYCHEIMFFKCEQMDYDVMKELIIKQVVSLFAPST